VNDLGCQVFAASINWMLDNGGVTVDLDRPAASRTEDDRGTGALLAELEAGTVGVLIVHGVNPVYDHPAGHAFAAAMKKTGLTVVFAQHTTRRPNTRHRSSGRASRKSGTTPSRSRASFPCVNPVIAPFEIPVRRNVSLPDGERIGA
jgi:hypothetical protein